MRNVFFCVMLVAGMYCGAGEILVKSGEKVAFLGDSITQFGAGTATGYVNLVASGLKANGIDIKVIRAGISGHKSNDMRARLDRDVLDKKPNWMLLSCGVNDVMHGKRGVELEPYKKNITEIVDKTLAKGVKLMILTATMIQENQKDSKNQKLIGYNDFLRKLATEKKCPLADLNADMQKTVKAYQDAGGKGNTLTYDGVHMDVAGDIMMAKGILRAFGLDDVQIKKAETAWMKLPVCYALTPRRMDKSAIKSRHYPYVEVTLDEVLNANPAQGAYIQQLDAKVQKALDKAFPPK